MKRFNYNFQFDIKNQTLVATEILSGETISLKNVNSYYLSFREMWIYVRGLKSFQKSFDNIKSKTPLINLSEYMVEWATLQKKVALNSGLVFEHQTSNFLVLMLKELSISEKYGFITLPNVRD